MFSQVRQRLATEAGAPDPRQQQYATLAAIAVVAGTIAGWMFGLHSAAIISGLTTVLALVAAGGESLRADMWRFLWLVPALALVMACGPLLDGIPVLAGLLVAVVVCGTGLLPALGENFRVAGQSFAAATLFSTTTGIGIEQPPLVLFAAAGSGAGFALLLRVLIGGTDPMRATRAAVARTLIEPGPGVVERAAAAWEFDGAQQWLGQVLAGAARFRAARETLLAQAQRVDAAESRRLRQIVAEADGVASEIAKAVRARACTGLPALARIDPADTVLKRGGRQDVPDATQGINQGLDQVRSAVVDRDTAPARPPTPGARRQRALGGIRAHLSWKSSLFRHAIRCTLAVSIGMVIVELLHDPSASSLLFALYLVLQPAARDSMAGALERTGGVVLGVVALAVLIAILPGAFLLVPLVIGAMLLSIDRLRTDYKVLLGALIVVTVVQQAMSLHRPLANIAISFAANTAVGAAIALAVGYISYLVLPSSMLPDVRGSVRATVWSVSELLRSIRAADRGADLREPLQAAHVLALRRTQDLLGVPAMLDSAEEEPEDERIIRSTAIALDALRQDIATLAFRPDDERSIAIPALDAVDSLLAGQASATIPDTPANSAPATELLASSLIENALHARSSIDQVLGYEQPWKSYTISFVRSETLRL